MPKNDTLYVSIPDEKSGMKVVVEVYDKVELAEHTVYAGIWEDPEYPDPFLLICNKSTKKWTLADGRTVDVEVHG